MQHSNASLPKSPISPISSISQLLISISIILYQSQHHTQQIKSDATLLNWDLSYTSVSTRLIKKNIYVSQSTCQVARSR